MLMDILYFIADIAISIAFGLLIVNTLIEGKNKPATVWKSLITGACWFLFLFNILDVVMVIIGFIHNPSNHPTSGLAIFIIVIGLLSIPNIYFLGRQLKTNLKKLKSTN